MSSTAMGEGLAIYSGFRYSFVTKCQCGGLVFYLLIISHTDLKRLPFLPFDSKEPLRVRLAGP